jgi:hypothetical protein
MPRTRPRKDEQGAEDYESKSSQDTAELAALRASRTSQTCRQAAGGSRACPQATKGENVCRDRRVRETQVGLGANAGRCRSARGSSGKRGRRTTSNETEQRAAGNINTTATTTSKTIRGEYNPRRRIGGVEDMTKPEDMRRVTMRKRVRERNYVCTGLKGVKRSGESVKPRQTEGSKVVFGKTAGGHAWLSTQPGAGARRARARRVHGTPRHESNMSRASTGACGTTEEQTASISGPNAN